ncbi:hypothetical protein GQX73_g1079 [Xylaria multiplex]|uniref:SnoaL-like domain-containing protein n=1 Tax=Xylaria multiplex TaxID=323545 RepID=A0A7C8MWZ3_9PEZI|nr:hypothetical protein GQX73_g1079 [Xylaria multiplex]
MAVSRWQRMQTIDALLDGYSSLSTAKLLEPLAPDFHHQTLPESLGMPVRNRDAFEKHASGVFGVFEDFRMIPRTIIDDDAAGIVAIDAQMRGTLKNGRGEWCNECVIIVRLTEDGCKVLDVREFVDSAKALEMAKNAPEHFSGEASSDTQDTSGDGLLGWRAIDSELWIHVGIAFVALIGLRRMLS